MRADAAEADRRLEVREAGRGWRRAGAIDEAALGSLHAAYPEDRHRLGPVFRLLVFGFTIMAANSCFGGFGFVLASGHGRASATLLVLFGLALVAATEYQLGPLRRRQAGAEAATAFLGLCYSTGGLVWFLSEASLGDAATINGALGLAALLFSAAAYRWGYSAFAAVGGIAFFLLLARGAWGRALWVFVPLLTTPLLLRAGDSARLPPAHRRGSQALAALGLIFFYVAVHVGSWDEGLVELIADQGRVRWEAGLLRTLSIAATALVPVLTVAWGIAARSRLLIDLGLVGVLASLVTLRFYVHVAPLWVVLLLGGAVALGLALALRRLLDSGPERERHGFTAEPLFADPEGRSALEVAAGMASLTPAARPAEKPGFEGGGGTFGGGGASGEF
jgi:hypothetical protein